MSARDVESFESIAGALLLELDRPEEAADSFRAALACACSAPERRFLARRLEQCV